VLLRRHSRQAERFNRAARHHGQMRTSTRTQEERVVLVQPPRPRLGQAIALGLGQGAREIATDLKPPHKTARRSGSTATRLQDAFATGVPSAFYGRRRLSRGVRCWSSYRRPLRGNCSQITSHPRSQHSLSLSAAEVNASFTFQESAPAPREKSRRRTAFGGMGVRA
jgi:hypothetical protein